jgi:NCS1 family nucleobase:cation symporter-1
VLVVTSRRPRPPGRTRLPGLSTLAWLCFLFCGFSARNLSQQHGAIRKFIDFCGPAVRGYVCARHLDPVANRIFRPLSLQLSAAPASPGCHNRTDGKCCDADRCVFLRLWLNFGDFARFGKSESAEDGQFLGLPVNFVMFSIVTVIVTAGTVEYSKPSWTVLTVEGSAIRSVAIGSITFIVATMGINIVTNFVSPAYDIANLEDQLQAGRPYHLGLSVLVCPWLFVASPRASRCSSPSSVRCWDHCSGSSSPTTIS